MEYRDNEHVALYRVWHGEVSFSLSTSGDVALGELWRGTVTPLVLVPDTRPVPWWERLLGWFR